MNAAHERDYQRRVEGVTDSRYLAGTHIEIIRELDPSVVIEHALFDFDGTLSLIREGWPDVMIPMMVEILAETNSGESEQELTALVSDFVSRLTGKQTIYQMIQLAEEVTKRGGKPEEPVVYKQWYHDRLMERIEGRRESLRSGQVSPETMLVPGTLPALRALLDRGCRLYLASGTDEVYVKEEAALLGLDAYFGPNIHGAVDDFKTFSKQMVIERILETHGIGGHQLVGFGDGYVEIDNVKGVGGIGVAVATDESRCNGECDPWKRDRLIGVGADVVVPDFGEYGSLFAYLWHELDGEA